ncbi:MAG: rhodanese-like domain-containing protein [Oscillospiraceae bacterium]|nr:rhodanese-like domain-containing protein [Oscillospiraceae bacterium]
MWRSLKKMTIRLIVFISMTIFFANTYVISNALTVNSVNTQPATYKKITPQTAMYFMKKYKNFIILDVRTKEEYDKEKIAGAILMPYTDIAKRAPVEIKNKYSLIFVYCRTGGRSSIAAHELVKLGYINVYDIGGISSWPYGTVVKK